MNRAKTGELAMAPEAAEFDDDNTGLHTVSPETHPARDAENSRRISQALENISDAEAALFAAVVAARAAGDSWGQVGAALGTSRQNAYQRFAQKIKALDC